MRGHSKLPVYVENAAEFLTTGNKKFTEKSVVIYSSVSGNTKEMVQLVDRVHEIGARVFAFIDTPDSILTQPDKQDYLILYPMNEQLKFYMTANYLMYKNGEFVNMIVIIKKWKHISQMRWFSRKWNSDDGPMNMQRIK